MEQSDQIDAIFNLTNKQQAALWQALSKAQGEFPDIPKNKTANVRGVSKKTGQAYDKSYNYADISDVRKAVQPALSKNNLAVSQIIKNDSLVTILAHSDGGSIESAFKLNLNQDPQSVGSLLTYMRRYALCGILNVAADEDIDGVGADNASSKQTTKPAVESKPKTLPNKAPAQPKPKVEPVKEEFKFTDPADPVSKEQIQFLAAVSRAKKVPDETMSKLIKKMVLKDSATQMNNEQYSYVLKFIQDNHLSAIEGALNA